MNIFPTRWTCLILGCASLAFSETAEHPRFTPEMETFVENFKPGGQDFSDVAATLSPAESLSRMRAAPGYAVELAASEPAIRQPLDMHFDERGQLWVVQYLQYPFPAGLTITSYDQYLRTEFDRLSPPPPDHFRGADKITIHEDTDGDGVYDRHKTFVDGLNMATSLALDHDGVWVLQSPYLLFYPDKNRDDVPDGDPEVHLTGFRLEDTHSLASSLHLGPDGWLYGASGSTTTLDIQGIRLLGQGIWRYHPGRKTFEVFAEGGGNTFSLEFDRYGRAYSGTNNGGTRGVHYVQGATYTKNWRKHGPAMDPFIFGYFPHMAHEGYTQRFPQAFHLHEADLMPELNGRIVVGMALTNRVQSSEVFTDTSTFRTVDRTALITTDDKAFRPVDVESGPDGAITIADWSDTRISHLNPRDTWQKSNGRIFRIVPENFVRPEPPNLRQLPTPELVNLLSHTNRWYREQARKLLAHRPESIAPVLQAMLKQGDDRALEALWVLNLRDELSDADLHTALRHPNEHVRRWAVRLLGDRRDIDAKWQIELIALAKNEPQVEVRSQLASSAKRLPAGQAFPIIRQLLDRNEDADDQHIPLLLWWAIESQADTGREELLAMMRDPDIWKTRVFRDIIADRLGRRFTADQGPNRYYTLVQGVYSEWQIQRSSDHLRRNLAFCAQLLETAPDQAGVNLLIAGMAEGLNGKPVKDVPPIMQATIERLWQDTPHTASLAILAARLGHADARRTVVSLLRSGTTGAADEQRLIEFVGSTGAPEGLPLLARMLRQEENEAKRARLMNALNGFDSTVAAELLMELYPRFSIRQRIVAQRMLSEKPAWARLMLQRITQGTFEPGVLSEGNIATIRAHGAPAIRDLLASYERQESGDPAEAQAQRLFDEGKNVFNLNCAACHHESGQGHPGLAPSLVASPWVQQGEEAMIRIVLQGKQNRGRGFVMPPMKHLDDDQVAAVLTYVRREFGNRSDSVAPGKVAEIRAVTADQEQPWSDDELKQLLANLPLR